MHPSARDLSDPESGSVKVTEPQETQTHRRWDQPSGPVFSSPNGSKIVGFLKRNTLFVLTIAAVALGKKSVISSTIDPFYNCEEELQPAASCFALSIDSPALLIEQALLHFDILNRHLTF